MSNVPERSGPPQPDPGQHVLQVATGYMVSAAIQSAVRLGVADHLAKGPRPVAELATATGSNEDALYRILRALSMLGVFTETAPRTFGLTPAGELLRADHPRSVRNLVAFMSDPFHFRVYGEMLSAAKTGAPAGERVAGMPLFEYFEKHPEQAKEFNDAMTTFSASVAPAMLKAYDFSGIDTLVDVAGGHGMILGSILRQYPKMRGILFDLEHVVSGATALDELGVRDRVTTASGDFFKAVPAGGDAYIMKHIIHDWDDERATLILKNIRTALEGKPHGKVILLEAVLRPGNEPDLGKLIDLEMLMLPGGRERTAEDFAALFTRAGFTLGKIVPTESPLAVIEAIVQ